MTAKYLKKGISAGLAAASLAACSMGGSEAQAPVADNLRYVAPAPAGSQSASRILNEDIDTVWSRLLTAADASGLTVEFLDFQSGLLVLSYEGDPGTNIDCGAVEFETVDEFGSSANAGSYIVASGTGSLVRRHASQTYGVNREMSLASRLSVRVISGGRETEVSSKATHVVTQALLIENQQSGDVSQERDMITFSSDQPGRSARGVVCQSTGQLEQLLLEDL